MPVKIAPAANTASIMATIRNQMRAAISREGGTGTISATLLCELACYLKGGSRLSEELLRNNENGFLSDLLDFKMLLKASRILVCSGRQEVSQEAEHGFASIA